MNTLETLKSLADNSQLVEKTRLTTYRQKAVIEQRLWIYFTGAESPMLIKKYWLSGDDRRDLQIIYHEYLSL